MVLHYSIERRVLRQTIVLSAGFKTSVTIASPSESSMIAKLIPIDTGIHVLTPSPQPTDPKVLAKVPAHSSHPPESLASPPLPNLLKRFALSLLLRHCLTDSPSRAFKTGDG